MMNRKIEKNMLRVAATWNIITAALTIFGYSSWFKSEGVKAFETQEELSYFSTSMLDSLISIIMIFGLFILAIGIINLFVAKSMDKQLIDKRMKWWLIACVIIHLLCFDLVAVILYLITVVIYCARNKAIKMSMLVSEGN